jgi:ATP-dependent RNA circularization protein (DNA/RNA ligase family)
MGQYPVTNIDIEDNKGEYVVVDLSNREHKNIKDTEGNNLKDTPDYILVCETVGHAAPKVASSKEDTGNVV